MAGFYHNMKEEQNNDVRVHMLITRLLSWMMPRIFTGTWQMPAKPSYSVTWNRARYQTDLKLEKMDTVRRVNAQKYMPDSPSK